MRIIMSCEECTWTQIGHYFSYRGKSADDFGRIQHGLEGVKADRSSAVGCLLHVSHRRRLDASGLLCLLRLDSLLNAINQPKESTARVHLIIHVIAAAYYMELVWSLENVGAYNGQAWASCSYIRQDTLPHREKYPKPNINDSPERQS